MKLLANQNYRKWTVNCHLNWCSYYCRGMANTIIEPKFCLRPRQEIFVNYCLKALMEKKNTLGIAPTGYGKTVMFAAIIGNFFEKFPQSKIMVFVRSKEILWQNLRQFREIYPQVSTSVYNANSKCFSGNVIFAMEQSLYRNLSDIPKTDLLVVDEAHHVVTPTFKDLHKALLLKNPELYIFGLTATPAYDKPGFVNIFTNVGNQVSLSEAIESGALVPCNFFVIDVGIKEKLYQYRHSGDYKEDSEVVKLMNVEVVNDTIVKKWLESCKGRKTIVFCSNHTHADEVCNSFIRGGVKATLITSEFTEPRRKEILHNFENGDTDVIVNVKILSEGYNYPPTSCIFLCRPYSAKPVMIQMVGRGWRTIDAAKYPNVIKSDCVVYDFGISMLTHRSLDVTADFNKTVEDKSEKEEKESWEHGGSGEADREVLEDVDMIPMKLTGKFRFDEKKLIRILKYKSSFVWVSLPWGTVGEIDYCMFGDGDVVSVVATPDSSFLILSKKDGSPSVLITGTKLICYSAAEKYLRNIETAFFKKSSKVHTQSVTQKQINFLCNLGYPRDAAIFRDLNHYKVNILLQHKLSKGAKIVELIASYSGKRYSSSNQNSANINNNITNKLG